MPEWNGSAGHEAALQAMVERADDIIEKKGEGVCICDLFEAARHRAQNVYVKTRGMGPDARMEEQARENALWGARGVIDGVYSGEGTDRVDPNDLVAAIVRGNEDPDDGALWAMVKRAADIKGTVSGRDLCELYRVARTASRSVAARPIRINAASGKTPLADPAKPERAACQAIDEYLEDRDENEAGRDGTEGSPPAPRDRQG